MKILHVDGEVYVALSSLTAAEPRALLRENFRLRTLLHNTREQLESYIRKESTNEAARTHTDNDTLAAWIAAIADEDCRSGRDHVADDSRPGADDAPAVTPTTP